jgi:hypothetical protein
VPNDPMGKVPTGLTIPVRTETLIIVEVPGWCA